MLPGAESKRFGIGCLNRIDDDVGGLGLINRAQNTFRGWIPGEYRFHSSAEALVLADALLQTISPQFDLLGGFLARDIKHTAPAMLQASRYLKQQGRLADARLTSQQHQGSGNEAAAQNPVEFRVAGGYPGAGRQWRSRLNEQVLPPGRHGPCRTLRGLSPRRTNSSSRSPGSAPAIWPRNSRTTGTRTPSEF